MKIENHHVLCPLDGSEQSETSLAAIMPLIRACGSRVTLLGAMADGTRALDVNHYLARARAALETQQVPVRCECRPGAPVEEILACARDGKPDLIAMSTRGRTGISRLFHASVTEEVLRQSDIPLLVCRPGRHHRELKKILVPLDEEISPDEILRDVSFLARRTGASVELFHTDLPLRSAPLSSGSSWMDYYGPRSPVEPKGLKEILERLSTAGIQVQGTSRRIPRVWGILERASQGDIDLICMATHGRQGLSRLLHGSTAEDVLRRAPCPVFVRRIPIDLHAEPQLGAAPHGTSSLEEESGSRSPQETPGLRQP